LNVTWSRRETDRKKQRGQSVAELAITLPALLLLFLGILQVGFLLFTQVGLTNAAREAARNASSIPVATSAQATTAMTTYLARLTDSTSGFLKRNVGGYDPSRLITTGGTRTRVCYYSFTDASGAPAVMARVEVEYTHPLFIPLVGPIIDGWDGTADGGVTLAAIEDIRVGNAVLSSTDIPNIGAPQCTP
jgi:Flp pilus assembly protein TadG